MSNSLAESALFYQSGEHLTTISHGRGTFVWDTLGKRYLDACSGAITCNLGHGHPAIRAAMDQQLDKIAFSYRTQFENQPAKDLAEKIVSLTQGGLHRVFLVGSGSEAVEASIKLARQYFVARAETQRRWFVSLRPSYHGSTLGALGLTGYHPLEEPFSDIMSSSVKVPSPDFFRMTEANEADHVECMLDITKRRVEAIGGDKVIAVVLEPVGGASTGARMLNQQYFDGIRALCNSWGCLLILDEVLTGLGRTGKWFAYQHWNAVPDVMALAKGLGAGYYPVGAAVAKRDIVDTVCRNGGFQHGHTYAGNPLAGATALAAIRSVENDGLLSNVQSRGAQLRSGLDDLKNKYNIIGDVRGIGLLQAVELTQNRESKQPFPVELNVFNRVTRIARSRGLLIYPRRCLDGRAGDHFLVTPPLNISQEEVVTLLDLLDCTLADLVDTL
ncbi:MAG: aminotransferase class III-fold pyridoxal phosphate-dependent enzyme [Lysobacterales bacterium]